MLFSGVAGVIQLGVANGAVAAYDPGRLTAPFGYLANAVVAPLARWDSVWYLTIAKSGYADNLRRMAFFPVYPGLIHIVGFFTRSDLVAGVLISLVAFAVALALLHRLVLLDFGEDVAETTVMLIAFCPVAFFFSAVYTESLFLALSVGAIYAARRERWLARGSARRYCRSHPQRRRRADPAGGGDLPLRPAHHRHRPANALGGPGALRHASAAAALPPARRRASGYC